MVTSPDGFRSDRIHDGEGLKAPLSGAHREADRECLTIPSDVIPAKAGIQRP
jgi:hypothetical protein